MKKVVPGLFRGPRPKDPEILLDWGINVVINLQSGFFQATQADEYERFDFYGNNITRVDIPMSNFWPPKAWEIVQAFRAIAKAKAEGKNTYIHCMSGVDRTGYLCAVYRMQQCGWSYKEALKEWIDEGRHFWFWWWKHSLEKWSLDGCK